MTFHLQLGRSQNALCFKMRDCRLSQYRLQWLNSLLLLGFFNFCVNVTHQIEIFFPSVCELQSFQIRFESVSWDWIHIWFIAIEHESAASDWRWLFAQTYTLGATISQQWLSGMKKRPRARLLPLCHFDLNNMRCLTSVTFCVKYNSDRSCNITLMCVWALFWRRGAFPLKLDTHHIHWWVTRQDDQIWPEPKRLGRNLLWWKAQRCIWSTLRSVFLVEGEPDQNSQGTSKVTRLLKWLMTSFNMLKSV